MELIESNPNGMKVKLEKAERRSIVYILFSIQIGAAIDQRVFPRDQQRAVFEYGSTADELVEIIDPGESERRSKKAKFRKEAREKGLLVSRKEIISKPEFNSQDAKIIEISFNEFEKLDRALELAVTKEKAFDPFFFDIRKVAKIQDNFRSLVSKARSTLLSDRAP